MKMRLRMRMRMRMRMSNGSSDLGEREAELLLGSTQGDGLTVVTVGRHLHEDARLRQDLVDRVAARPDHVPVLGLLHLNLQRRHRDHHDLHQEHRHDSHLTKDTILTWIVEHFFSISFQIFMTSALHASTPSFSPVMLISSLLTERGGMLILTPACWASMACNS